MLTNICSPHYTRVEYFIQGNNYRCNWESPHSKTVTCSLLFFNAKNHFSLLHSALLTWSWLTGWPSAKSLKVFQMVSPHGVASKVWDERFESSHELMCVIISERRVYFCCPKIPGGGISWKNSATYITSENILIQLCDYYISNRSHKLNHK